MGFRIRIHYVGGPPAWARELPEVVAAAMRAVAAHWHRAFLPLHFKPGATERYGYDARKKLTDPPKPAIQAGRILRMGLSWDAYRLPLIWSGLLRQQATRPAIIRAEGPKGMAIMNVPSYLWRPGGGSAHKAGFMYLEMTTVTEAEMAELATLAQTTCVEAVQGNMESTVMEVAA